MALLLDTHALIWLEHGDPRLGSATKLAVQSAVARAEVFISPISFWEIGLLVAKRRMSLGLDLPAFRMRVLQAGYIERLIDGHDTVAMAALPNFHGDPADRLLVAVARNAGLTLATADGKILAWKGKVGRMDCRK